MPQGAGPPYPRYPAGWSPGGQPIGEFVIGESPIGTILVFDVWATIISQYANSEALTDLITSFNAALDPTEFLEGFFDFYVNVMTAVGNGLDIWGRIVGVGRTISIIGGSTFFGFEEASSWTNFYGPGTFFSGASVANTFTLSDADFRVLILAKAASNITDDSIPAINAIMLALFPNTQSHVTDGLDMTMTYALSFAPSPLQLAILQTSGVLPTPAGVAATITHP